MKIIGPAAGIGSRLRPFTYSKPKGFLKVAGKKVIDHILDLFKKLECSQKELLIITGFQSRSITTYINEKYSHEFNIQFKSQKPKGFIGDIPYYHGLGDAINLSEEWYRNQISSYDSKDPEDYSMIFLSDMLPIEGYEGIFNKLCGKKQVSYQKNNLPDDFKDDDESIKKEKESNKNTNNNLNEIDGIIGIMEVPKERTNSYGIIEADKKSGYIQRLIEKPKTFISNLAIAGIYAFKPKAMKRLYKHLTVEVKKYEKKMGEAHLAPAIQGLVNDGFNIAFYNYGKGENILDFGKPETLLEGNRFLLNKHSNILGGPIEKISNSSLISPSFIGTNVEIENCVLGQFVSIGDNCVLKDCILRNSVIGDNCSLEKIITENSIIGDFVVMDDLIKDNLIIGDRSNIRSSK